MPAPLTAWYVLAVMLARPYAACSGPSASANGMVVQLGLATSRTEVSTRRELTPATTSGTFGSARYVLLLAITR